MASSRFSLAALLSLVPPGFPSFEEEVLGETGNVSGEPTCSTCQGTQEVYTEPQLDGPHGIPGRWDPCPDCVAPVPSPRPAWPLAPSFTALARAAVILRAVNPWTCDASELPPVAPLQEMQPAWWAITTVPALGTGCVLCGDGLGLKTVGVHPSAPPECLCSRCRDFFRESLEAGKARFPEAGTAQDFRSWGVDERVGAGLSDSSPHLPVYPESRTSPGLS
jgi:hypothetical protein